MSPKAPLHGTWTLYCYIQDSKVLLIKEGYQLLVISKDTFKHLYFELSDEKAALKEDCIDYVPYQPGEPLTNYPEWFIEAYDNGDIYEEDGYEDLLFYNEYGDIVMSPGSVILRNYMGQLDYMERDQFDRYYDAIGEWL